MPPTPARRAPFPIQHAFVVQFAADTGLDAQGLAGRVEHVTPGQGPRLVGSPCEMEGAGALHEGLVEVEKGGAGHAVRYYDARNAWAPEGRQAREVA